MNVFRYFRDVALRGIEELVEAAELPAGLDVGAIAATPPRDPAHGDVALNAAMVLAKPAGRPPRQIAEALATRLRARPGVVAVDVAGPGFINIRLGDAFWHDRLLDILRAGAAYGDSDLGAGAAVNVEYVSANPTGPLHVGHGRGAVFGDALAALLEKAGYRVTREYYINDAGGQIEALVRSLHWRYREALGQVGGDVPDGLYPGDYLVGPARALAARDGERWAATPETEWLPALRDFAIDQMMALVREDLDALAIRHAVFFSERTLHASGRIGEALDALAAKGEIYEGVLEPPKGKPVDDWEPRPQTLFRASKYGDDVDRPLKKSDGTWTYFAADIAYHYDKYLRGFRSMIDVWGADHGGYVKRVQAALRALAGSDVELDVKLCSMVRVLDGGVPVKMSKRSGDFVTLRDVVDAVGKDVVRFIMLTRRNDAQLDFDLKKVLEQSKDNPVFYVQYAHARCRSIARRVAEELPAAVPEAGRLTAADLARLGDPGEQALIRKLASWPEIVDSAARAHEPHRVAFFLHEVAADFHAQWNRGNEDESMRFYLPDDVATSRARAALVLAVQHVIASGLAVMGVTPAEEMR